MTAADYDHTLFLELVSIKSFPYFLVKYKLITFLYQLVLLSNIKLGKHFEIKSLTRSRKAGTLA